MPTMIMGMSASLCPTATLSTAAQLQRLGVRTFTRSGFGPPRLLMK